MRSSRRSAAPRDAAVGKWSRARRRVAGPLLGVCVAIVAVWMLPLGPHVAPLPAPAPAVAATASGASAPVSGLEVTPVSARGAAGVETASTLITCAPRLRAATTAGVEGHMTRPPGIGDRGRTTGPERPRLVESQHLGTGCTNRGPPEGVIA